MNGRVDLCATCRNAEICVYCIPERDPVLQCDRFVTRERNDPGALTWQRVLVLGVHHARGESLAGLCLNCCRSDRCVREKPLGGVWRCEDYC